MVVNKLNTSLWIAITGLLIAGVGLNHYFSSIDISLRLIAWLFLVGLVGLLALRTSQGQVAWEFVKEARIELRKVVWPTRKETGQMTLMVVILVMIIALFIWGIDTLFLNLISWLTA